MYICIWQVNKIRKGCPWKQRTHKRPKSQSVCFIQTLHMTAMPLKRRCQNGLNDPKETKVTNCLMMKYEETFYGRHTAIYNMRLTTLFISKLLKHVKISSVQAMKALFGISCEKKKKIAKNLLDRILYMEKEWNERESMSSKCTLNHIYSKRSDWQALDNNVDPDQTPLNAVSDQDLYCLLLIHSSIRF